MSETVSLMGGIASVLGLFISLLILWSLKSIRLHYLLKARITNNSLSRYNSLIIWDLGVARPEGFEPPTYGFEVQWSSQPSYGRTGIFHAGMNNYLKVLFINAP